MLPYKISRHRYIMNNYSMFSYSLGPADPVDLTFIIDRSGSVRRSNFELALKFIEEVCKIDPWKSLNIQFVVSSLNII